MERSSLLSAPGRMKRRMYGNRSSRRYYRPLVESSARTTRTLTLACLIAERREFHLTCPQYISSVQDLDSGRFGLRRTVVKRGVG